MKLHKNSPDVTCKMRIKSCGKNALRENGNNSSALRLVTHLLFLFKFSLFAFRLPFTHTQTHFSSTSTAAVLPNKSFSPSVSLCLHFKHNVKSYKQRTEQESEKMNNDNEVPLACMPACQSGLKAFVTIEID